MPETEPATRSAKTDFEQATREGRTSIFVEFIQFLMHNKKWWLLPIVIVLLFIGVLVFLSSTAAAPFVYTMF